MATEAETTAKPIRIGLNLTTRRAILVTTDLVMVCGAAVLALVGWSITARQPFSGEFMAVRLWWLPVLGVVWLLLSRLTDMYDLYITIRRGETFRRLAGVVLLHLALYVFVFFFAPRDSLPRLFLLFYLMGAFMLVAMGRLTYGLLLTQSIFQQKMLILGAGWGGKELLRMLKADDIRDFCVVGFVDDDRKKRNLEVDGTPVLGGSDDLPSLVRENEVDIVVVAISHELNASVFQSLLDCQAEGIRVVRMSGLYESLTGRVPVQHIRNDWLLPSQVEGGQPGLTYRVFNWLLDACFVLFGGLLLAVIFPAVALAIKLDSPGPVFYRQVRSGLGGRSFELLKFRSMVPDAEEESGARWAEMQDARVTCVGRFLRRTRIDELPQVINVLRADMSFIGPRPERPEFISKLQEEIPFYRARLAVRPGLTGWAQVRYRYGNTEEDALVKLQYDLYYIKSRSIIVDLSILFRTLIVILTMKGV